MNTKPTIAKIMHFNHIITEKVWFKIEQNNRVVCMTSYIHNVDAKIRDHFLSVPFEFDENIFLGDY